MSQSYSSPSKLRFYCNSTLRRPRLPRSWSPTLMPMDMEVMTHGKCSKFTTSSLPFPGGPSGAAYVAKWKKVACAMIIDRGAVELCAYCAISVFTPLIIQDIWKEVFPDLNMYEHTQFSVEEPVDAIITLVRYSIVYDSHLTLSSYLGWGCLD